MNLRTLLLTAFSLLTTLVTSSPASASPAHSPQSDDLHVLDGDQVAGIGADQAGAVAAQETRGGRVVRAHAAIGPEQQDARRAD